MLSREQIQPLLSQAFEESNLPIPGKQSGKVRDWYSLGSDRQLIITTDRLSAFDRVLAAVPYKGQVLNQLSAWWFDHTADIIANHQISVPDPNALISRVAQPLPIEVIVRGFITWVTKTALWYRYALGEREIYGYKFPEGLQKNTALPGAIITPTTKGGPTGHDERLTCAEVVEKGLLDAHTWDQVQAAALALFQRGQEIAAKAGLILVDTKYEFGFAPDGSVMLIDEVHTPDSSRFWKAENYDARLAAGQEPELFDKEFVRLAYASQGYRGDGEPPVLPQEVWVETSQLYQTIYEGITGQSFNPGTYPVEPRLRENLANMEIKS
ncbi:MAG: phosphoribosylaminoimidazolesuccinocarboxamide synthase [Anaerolineaceae bacterium]